MRQALDEALKLEPDNWSTLSVLLFDILSLENITDQEIKSYAQQYGQAVGKLNKSNYKFPSSQFDGNKKIRVGIVSPDLRKHSVAYFLMPLICNIPRDKFSLNLYFMHPTGYGDGITDQMKEIADVFRYIEDNRPEKIAQIIRKDQVDVLIDVAGHTANTGLHAMALQPAPVQLTWLGYPGTTGLQTMKYRVTDSVADPIGSEGLYFEKLIRINPLFCVYRPHVEDHKRFYDSKYFIRKAPCDENGFITFGSLNNLGKITDRVLSVWAKIVNSVNGSKLLIEAYAFADAKLRSEFVERCLAAGLRQESLLLVTRKPNQQYLIYNMIDISIDTFPQVGGTTTFDSLWMGVPVVSVRGSSFRSRITESILTAVGEVGCIAQDEVEYINKAVEIAKQPRLLSERRLKLRLKMMSSALMNEAAFAEKFCRAIRLAWKAQCKDTTPYEQQESSTQVKSHEIELKRLSILNINNPKSADALLEDVHEVLKFYPFDVNLINKLVGIHTEKGETAKARDVQVFLKYIELSKKIRSK
jgi:predicted O-linked N-acetylglucosamine transferase (SPINDLY family)